MTDICVVADIHSRTHRVGSSLPLSTTWLYNNYRFADGSWFGWRSSRRRSFFCFFFWFCGRVQVAEFLLGFWWRIEVRDRVVFGSYYYLFVFLFDGERERSNFGVR